MKPNNHGFSLIQVLVGVAIMSIVGLSMASLISNSYQHESRLSVILEGRELAGEFLDLVKSPNCGIVDLAAPINVIDSTWTETTQYSLTNGISGRFLTLKDGDKYGVLNIERVTISPYRDKSQNTEKYIAINGDDENDFAKATTIKASLSLEVSAKGAVKAPLKVPIYLYLNPARNQIVGCESMDVKDSLAAACESVSGQWDEGSLSCTLPCPAGMTSNEGVCTVENNAKDEDQLYCPTNEQCTVKDKYVF